MLQTAHLKDMLATMVREEASVKDKCDIQYITDYVILPKASCRNRDQNLGRDLVLKDKNKVPLDSVMAPQWAGASVHILLENMHKINQEEISAYLQYMAQISDYLQVCEPYSVMLLDEEHCIKVAREGRSWDNIDQMKA